MPKYLQNETFYRNKELTAVVKKLSYFCGLVFFIIIIIIIDFFVFLLLKQNGMADFVHLI